MAPPRIPLPCLGRSHDLLPAGLRPINFRVVRTLDEFVAAANLTYREYVVRRYMTSTSSQLKLSIYHALPQTTTFIAWHRSAGVIGTIALIEDSPLGLPMDDAYKAELDIMRRQGLRLAEASMLTLDSRLFSTGTFSMTHTKKLLLLMRLFKVLFDYVRATPTQELVACFHPKHQLLFEFLGLAPLGGLKAYAGANGTPALARHLNLETAERQAMGHPAYRFFFGRKSSARAFARKLVLSSDDLRRLFVLDSGIFASASPSELAYLMSCYPTYNFSKIVEGALPASSMAPLGPHTTPDTGRSA